jgi:hypothetical protein
MNIKLVRILAALVCLGPMAPASASNVTVTFSGIFDPAGDPGGFTGTVKGIAASTLQGDAVTGSFVYDNAVVGSAPDPTFGRVNYLTGVGTMTLFIGSTDFSATGPAFISLQPVPALGKQLFQIDGSAQNTSYSYELETFGTVLFDDVSNLSSVAFTDQSGVIKLIDRSGFWNVELSSVTVTSAVPEPSTWAMMILGFFGIGTMTYRRRKSAMLAA